jgi:hypothetical protein
VVKQLLFIGFVILSLNIQAQIGDLPKVRPIIKGQNPNLGVKKNSTGTLLRMPSVLDSSLTRPRSGPQLIDQSNLKDAGFDLVIDPKIALAENTNSKLARGDMYLGDIETSADHVGIAIRDHGEIDGDRVLILVNEVVVEYNALLSGRFQKLNVELKDGFNAIEFKALNQGYAGLNTAQLLVLDENGEAIKNQSWYLATGSTAKIIVVKTPTLKD